MMRWVPKRGKPFDPMGHRILGFTDDGQPICLPKGHSLTIAANGAGKTTNIGAPAVIDLSASEPGKALLVFDGKNGELAAQAAQMLADLGRRVYVIDDFNTRPELAHLKISLNPFGAAIAAQAQDPRFVTFALETLSHTLIEEPSEGDARNKYWRAWPRTLIEFAILVMLTRNPASATPGAAMNILSDPSLLTSFAQIEAEESDGLLRSHARSITDMRGHEHFPQHLEEATRALRAFGPGTHLADVGLEAAHSHESLIQDGAIIFLCGPQSIMSRLGAYYALHIQSFCNALYNGAGTLRAVCDEFSNMPLKSLVDSLTTLRGYGGEFHMIVQSRSELQRKFGKDETATIEDNAITKTWLGFSSFEEAERVSRVIGEEHAVSESMGFDDDTLKINTNLSLNRQRHLSPGALMAIPRGKMLCHIKGFGFFVANTLGQHQRAPYCNLLAPNPLEGGRLPPDPKITLVTPKGHP